MYPRDITGTEMRVYSAMDFISNDNNSIAEVFRCGQSFRKLRCIAAKPHTGYSKNHTLRFNHTIMKNSMKHKIAVIINSNGKINKKNLLEERSIRKVIKKLSLNKISYILLNVFSMIQLFPL